MYRFNVALSGLRILLLAGIALLLAACNGGGSSSTTSSTLSGTAAVGAPVDGYVYVVDVNGTEVNAATNATTGAWTVAVTGMTGPFLIRVVPNGGGDMLYSYAGSADITVNITPLTHLALYLALNGDLDALYTNWAANNAQLTAQAIANAQAVINANFATEMDAEGLDHASYDFFGDDFPADSTGIDALLDNLTISIDFAGGTYTILVGGISFILDEAIDTTGIDIGGSTGGGGGGGNTTISCDTTQYQAGAVSEPTAAEVASFAATYAGQEGTYGPNPGDPFVASGNASFVLNSDGTATYNGASYDIVSYCLDNSVSLLYVMDASGSHFDLFGNGDIYGVTPNGDIAQP
ncbi:MAG: hypothetical protein HY941_11600 [Gammaproteobacteria bacterium]|nr:hypothetical protein [Gammaproteobacteria bacterium]